MNRIKVSWLALSAMILLTVAAPAQPTIEYGNGKVWVKDLDEEVLHTFLRYNGMQADLREIFGVVMRSQTGNIPISGEYATEKTSVSFTPRFPFVRGENYYARFDLGALTNNHNEIYQEKRESAPLELEFTIERFNSDVPGVAAIYPSGQVVPENLLKFHIAFNTPMTAGEIYDRVKLVDAQGRTVDRAFLILDQELWDEQMKTATVLFDPGRIKRGLRQNLEMRPPLKEGEMFRIVVDAGWKDGNGEVIADPYVKEFKVGAADRNKVNIRLWDVRTPTSSTGPLMINLHETFDFIMLGNSIRIEDSEGKIVEGTISNQGDESVITFTPSQAWKADTYTIHVNPLLEDLAGNNLNRLFDEDLSVKEEASPKRYTLTFRVTGL